jgi:hypothetical protein
MTRRDQREAAARQLDRWIGLLAQLDGVPRLTMVRCLRTPAHLQVAVAQLIAADRRADAARAAELAQKKQQDEAEMRAYLEELKAEQDAMRAEQT